MILSKSTTYIITKTCWENNYKMEKLHRSYIKLFNLQKEKKEQNKLEMKIKKYKKKITTTNFTIMLL